MTDEIPEARGWSMRRYLLTVLLATAVALAGLACARPSIFTGIVVALGIGHRWAEVLPDSFYAVRVAPILEEHCASCHGPRLRRARLRLDSLGDLSLGGKSGAAVVPGNPHASELYTRLLLPRSDKRAMPAANKPPLTANQIRVIEMWIASGASGRTLVDEIKGAPPPPTPPIVIAPLDLEAVVKARAPLEEEVAALSERYPQVISYLSRDSARLAIDAQRLRHRFQDSDLALFEPLAVQVARLDLSGTAITDAAALAAFENVETLRLNDTDIGEAAIAAIGRMPNLKTLTILDTQLTPEHVAQLRERGVKVYDGR